MKLRILIRSTIVVFYLVFLLLGCSDKVEEPGDLTQYPIFGSLKGVWKWSSTYDAKKGLIGNDFETTIHFISMNTDSTINYETYKRNSLKKSG